MGESSNELTDQLIDLYEKYKDLRIKQAALLYQLEKNTAAIDAIKNYHNGEVESLLEELISQNLEVIEDGYNI